MRKFLLFILLLVSITVQAQQEIQNFSLINTKDGKSISLNDYRSLKGVVVVFTSHECPYDNYYKERLKELVNIFSGKIQFLLINSNQEPQENAEQMAIHYGDLSVPYLADKDQTVMEALGAKKSPEVFLLSTNSGKFIIAYSGAIDDNPQVAKDVKQTFLKDAIGNLMAGQKTEPTTQRATGCTIRRK